jgi:polysaccharide biosynthesis protein PslH
MRVLICATELPVHPLNGTTLQMVNIADQLTQRGHEVCIVGFREPSQAPCLPPSVQTVAVAPPSRRLLPRITGWLRSFSRREPVESVQLAPRLGRAVTRVLREQAFDVAHVTVGAVASISPYLSGIPMVLVPVDAWQLNAATRADQKSRWLRPFYEIQLRFVRRFIQRYYPSYDQVILVSEEDAEATRLLSPAVNVTAIPNGVDSDRLKPDSSKMREADTILFVGVMGFPPNKQAARDLALNILPLVRQQRPAARLLLVGRSPEHVAALANEPGVQVEGEVPDILPYLQRATVFACPVRSGTGIKSKLLEAFAAGTPAVATPLGCRGMQVSSDRHLLVADGDAEFAACIARLLADPDLSARLRGEAREYVVREHSWAGVASRYEDAYRHAIGSSGRVNLAGEPSAGGPSAGEPS